MSIQPVAPRVGAPVQLQAYGYDDDGSIAAIAFDVDDDGSFETPADVDGQAATTFAAAGTRRIRARFTDDGGATTVARQSVEVQATNLAPVASLSTGRSSVRTGRVVPDLRRLDRPRRPDRTRRARSRR